MLKTLQSGVAAEEAHIVKNLGLLAASGADPQGIADAAVAVWSAIDGALVSRHRRRGIAALYKRSLHLARAQHPWLAAAYEGALQPGDYSALRAALAQQTASERVAGPRRAPSHTFNDLLADLIGRSAHPAPAAGGLVTQFMRQRRAGHIRHDTIDKATIKRLAHRACRG